MSQWHTRYPRTVGEGAGAFQLRVMTAADEAAVLAFARTLPTHDLLFLRRDIRQPRVMSAWIRQLEAGDIQSLLALRDGQLVGCSAIARDPHSFSPHVGDLRVILAPESRELGLGRLLIQESFLVAMASGLEKLTVHMTGYQQAAIRVFEDMGFRPEALLRDQVRDDHGNDFDIVILGQNVQAHLAKLDLYGITGALS